MEPLDPEERLERFVICQLIQRPFNLVKYTLAEELSYDVEEIKRWVEKIFDLLPSEKRAFDSFHIFFLLFEGILC